MSVVPLAVQLYSVRELADRDLGLALDRVAACGYSAVEPFGLHGLDPRHFRRALRERDLQIVAFHRNLGGGDALEAELEWLAALGVRRVIVPWSDPQRLHSREDVDALAARLNALREAVARWEMELGYHNHWWEFARRLGGRTLHDLLFAQLHPAIFAEIDVYWTARRTASTRS